MADLKQCNIKIAHKRHRWIEEIANGVHYHHCRGIVEQSRPADILITPTEAVLPSIDDELQSDGTENDQFKGYTFDTRKLMWIHDECESYIANPLFHTQWHERLDARFKELIK